jgi:hypothetical protein
MQGEHKLLNLATKSVISRRTVTPVPMTATVISSVEAMAKADHLTKFVIRSKCGQIFYGSSWLAGVDYVDEVNDDDVYNDPDYEEEADGSDYDDDVYNDTDYEEETDGSDTEAEITQESDEESEISEADPVQENSSDEKEEEEDATEPPPHIESQADEEEEEEE